MKKAFVLVLLVIPIIIGSSFAYVRNKSTNAIEEADQILSDINESKFDLTEDQLQEEKDKFQGIIFWLENTPNLPRMPYQEAQNQLRAVEDTYLIIDRILDNNEIAEAALQKADELIVNLDVSQPRDISYWESEINSLNEAIELLQSAPTELSSTIQTQIKDALSNYSSRHSQAKDSLSVEREAANGFKRAENLNQQASEILRESKASIQDLENAQSQVNEALNIINDIPSNTTVATQVLNGRENYERTLESISNKLEEAIRNACPYTYQDFKVAISEVSSQTYYSFSDIASGETALEEITRAYEDSRCEDLRPQIRNILLTAWENHYNKEFNKASDVATLQSIVFCQPLDRGCPARAREAERQSQNKLRQLNETRNDNIATIRNRL